ncbi:MAG: hypothetical protein ABIQ86_00850 [Steroidobacteraceae bacterium]
MSDALLITVILNIASGHGDAAVCEREIRTGLDAEGRAHRRITRVAVVVPRTPEERK